MRKGVRESKRFSKESMNFKSYFNFFHYILIQFSRSYILCLEEEGEIIRRKNVKKKRSNRRERFSQRERGISMRERERTIEEVMRGV